MRAALLAVLLAACGGRITGEEGQKDAGASDHGESIFVESGLLTGPCTFTFSFKPTGMDWIKLRRLHGLASGSRPTLQTFLLVCAASDNEPGASGFYFYLKPGEASLAAGASTTHSILYINKNAREVDTAEGPCTVKVAEVSNQGDRTKVVGAFDCADLAHTNGSYALQGDFTLYLR